MDVPLVGRYVNLQVKVTVVLGREKKMKSGFFFLLGSYPLVGRHVD